MKNRVLIKNLKELVGQEVTVAGFVDIRRDHGKLIFIDLRDETGKVQMIALPNHRNAHDLAGTIRPEWVISVCGKVNKRPERMVKADQENGAVEIEALKITVLGKAKVQEQDGVVASLVDAFGGSAV